MKKCPYCAEEIQEEAVVCKHCGRDLTAPQHVQIKKPAGKTALYGVGFLALGIVASAIVNNLRPTTQAGVLIPNIIATLLLLTGIVLFIIAIVQVVQNRKIK